MAPILDSRHQHWSAANRRAQRLFGAFAGFWWGEQQCVLGSEPSHHPPSAQWAPSWYCVVCEWFAVGGFGAEKRGERKRHFTGRFSTNSNLPTRHSVFVHLQRVQHYFRWLRSSSRYDFSRFQPLHGLENCQWCLSSQKHAAAIGSVDCRHAGSCDLVGFAAPFYGVWRHQQHRQTRHQNHQDRQKNGGLPPVLRRECGGDFHHPCIQCQCDFWIGGIGLATARTHTPSLGR